MTGNHGEMTVYLILVIDCFTFSSIMVRNDVLIENTKYGCTIMQNNGAMRNIVNFTHA